VRITRFGIFLAAVFAAKLVVVLQLRDHPLLQPDAGLDTTVYTQLAAQVAGGNLWLGPGLYFVSPLYIYFLAAILAAGGTFITARVIQIVLGTAAVAFVFVATREWFGRRAAWMAAVFAALTGLFTFHEVLLLQAALDPFLTAAALASLAVAFRRAAVARGATDAETPGDARAALAWFALSGLAFGVQALNRPNVLVPAAAIAVLLAAARRWTAAAAVAIGLVAALTPLTIRNLTISGDWSPLSSHGGLNFYIGNNAEADGTYRPVPGITADVSGQQEDARRVAESSVGRRLDDAEVSAYFYGLGWSWMRLHPGDAVRLFARKLGYTFDAAYITLNASYAFYAYDARTLLAVLFVGPWLLLALGLTGLVIGALATARRTDFLIWASFVPVYAVSVAIFFASERYRVPLLVPLCVGAGHVVDRIAFFRLRPAAAKPGTIDALGIVLLVALAFVTNLPIHADDGRAEERARMAEAMVTRDEIDAAEQWVQKAEAGYPNPAVLHFRVGRLLLVHHRPDAALVHFRRALDLEPGRAEVEYGMGQALVDAKRFTEAIPHLQAALRAGVRVDLAGYDLARARAGAGDRAGALQTLQGIRPENPNDAVSWSALGQLALQLQSPSLGAAFFTEAVRAAPSTSKPHQDLGLSLAMMGRYQEAIAQFEQSVTIDPRDPAAQLNLAVAYAETGRKADARAHAEEALRLNPNYDRAKQFLRALR
jgi:tetratricopeptide (TPR) repeat protein/4-amino-4-deoxy-L-arabinose transferase-like glycosyltransferase